MELTLPTCYVPVLLQGTAATEAEEFNESYRLSVVKVPPHRPSLRRDHPMRVFFFQHGKRFELLSLLLEAVERGQPVLIGTGSVEDSERAVQFISAELA